MANGVVAGKLEIPIEADTSTFEEKLKRKIEAVANRIDAKVKAVIDGDQLRAELEHAVQSAVEGVEATIRAVIDADGLRDSLVTAVEEASAGVTADVKAVLDADQLRAELELKAKAAAEGFELKVKTSVDGIVGQVVAAEAEAQAAADADPVKVPVKLNEKDLSARLLGIITKLRAEAAAVPPVEVKTKVNDGGLKGLTKLLRPGLYLGIFSLIQPLVALLGQAAAGAGALVSAISPAVGALGALPGVISTLGIALATLKVGFGGFTKAITSYAQAQANLKKTSQAVADSQASINKRMAALSPAEQQAVKNYKNLTSAQAGYRAGLAKLTPQEAAAVRSVQRLNGQYTTTAKQTANLSVQMGKLSPQQRKAVDEALRLAAAGKSTTATLKGLSPQAQQLVKDMRALEGQNKKVTAAQKAVDAALKDLSPSAKTAALAIYGLQGAWKDTKKAVQESIFSGFAKDIEPAAKTLLPLLSSGLSGVGTQLGKVIHQAIQFTQTPLFRAQFRVLADQAATSVSVLGRSGLGLATAFGNVAVASIPLQNRMLGVIARFSAWTASATSGTEAGKKMRAFFDDAGNTAGRLSRILLDVGKAIYGIFKAGRGAGDTLLGGIERQARRLLDYVNSPKGFKSIKSYFDDAVPGARALASLVGAIFRGFGRLSRDNGLASMLDELQNRLGPALEHLLNEFGRNLGPQIVDTVSELVRLLGNLSSAASPLSILATAIASIAAGLNAVLDVFPGLGPAIGTLLGFAAAAKVFGLMQAATKSLALQLLGLRVKIAALGTGRLATVLSPLINGLRILAGGLVTGVAKALIAVRVNAETATLAAKGLVGALSVIGVALAANQVAKWSAGLEVPTQKVKDLSSALGELGTKGTLGQSGLDLMSKGMGPLQESAGGTADALDRFATSAYNALSDDWSARIRRMQDMGEVEEKFKDQTTQLDGALADMAQHGNAKEAAAAFQKLADAATANGVPLDKLKAAFPQYEEAMKGVATATDKQRIASEKAGNALQTIDGKMRSAASGADKMKSAMDSLLGLFQSVPQAEAGFEQSLSQLTGKIDRSTKAFLEQHNAFDLTTQSGRDLQGQLIGMLQENAAVADAIRRTTGSTKKANEAWNEGVRRIKQHLVQMGLTPAAAQKVIDKLGGVKDAVNKIPKLAQLKISALGTDAVLNALSLIDGKIIQINGKKVTVRASTDFGGSVKYTSTDAAGHTRTSTAHATGGLFRGRGGPMDDANVTRISNGEFIVRAARTQRFRALLEAINSGSERAIQSALGALSGAGRAVAGIAARAATALPEFGAIPATGGRVAVSALRPGSSPIVMLQQPPAAAPAGGGKTTIVDADGQLIGTMRTAATRTHRAARQADRLGGIGTWGAAPAWG